MTRKDSFTRLLRDAFAEPAQWVRWMGEKVFREGDFLSVDDDSGATLSGMLLSPYSMLYSGAPLQAGYISCVATLREHRGKGLMRTLMHRALNAAAERGIALCSLIPASDPLYFMYEPFGFSTIYYIDEQRYTSLHRFDEPDDYVPVEPTYALLEELEAATEGSVLHSRRDFDNILADLAFDSGECVAVEGPQGSRAMAFAVPGGGDVATVKYLGATDIVAEEAALAQVRRTVGQKQLSVWMAPGVRTNGLRSRAMGRIVNAGMILAALAAASPATEQVIRVHDPIVETNSGIYILRRGECDKVESTMRRITLDVDVSVLTRILFSAPEIGSVFGLPTSRPQLPLMLD